MRFTRWPQSFVNPAKPLPEWLKTAITLEKMTGNIKALIGEKPNGTDAKVCAYLSTASLTAPMDDDWSQIYLYVAGKTYRRWHKSEMPDDVRVDSLNDQQTADVNGLKEWLYRQRISTGVEKGRAERRRTKEETETLRNAEQPVLFEF